MPAITIENLSKQYQIGSRSPVHTTFREALSGLFMSPLVRLRRLSGRSHEHEQIWALKDVCFDVQPGEVIGIIGRNGAGKSTLLKILSQITEPTTGRVELNGRVSSLLEVGTGFHPELTGRENVFLNGAILGMSRREISRKFDEIVAFAEIDKFLDTPVKRYSSGMYTRLAFSVAAHMEPEILIVDEVLAVGDASFQKKCLGRMSSVAKQGRTVLFVSHNMAAVESLCTRGIVLEQGKMTFDGDQNDAVQQYLKGIGNDALVGLYEADPVAVLNGSKQIMITRAWVTSGEKDEGGQFPIGSPMEFRVEGVCQKEGFQPQVGFGIENHRGYRICTLHTKCAAEGQLPTHVGKSFAFTCRVPCLPLIPGDYSVKLGLAEGEVIVEMIDSAFRFTIRHSDFFGNAGKKVGGLVYVEQEWSANSALGGTDQLPAAAHEKAAP